MIWLKAAMQLAGTNSCAHVYQIGRAVLLKNWVDEVEVMSVTRQEMKNRLRAKVADANISANDTAQILCGTYQYRKWQMQHVCHIHDVLY